MVMALDTDCWSLRVCMALPRAAKLEEKKWLRLVRRSALWAGALSTSMRLRNFLSRSLRPLSLRVSAASRSETVCSLGCTVKNEAGPALGEAACSMVSSSFWLTVCGFFFLLPNSQDITIASLNSLAARAAK